MKVLYKAIIEDGLENEPDVKTMERMRPPLRRFVYEDEGSSDRGQAEDHRGDSEDRREQDDEPIIDLYSTG